jgi:hypothetical protein
MAGAIRISDGHPIAASSRHSSLKEGAPMSTILLIILVLFLVGALPRWPHSANWGYYPSSGVGIILIIVVILLLTGRL